MENKKYVNNASFLEDVIVRQLLTVEYTSVVSVFHSR